MDMWPTLGSRTAKEQSKTKTKTSAGPFSRQFEAVAGCDE